MSKPNISLLLPDLRGGGAEKVAVNLVNGFAQRGLSVELVLLEKTGVFLPLLGEGVSLISLDVHRLRNLLVPLVNYLRSQRPESLLVFMWPLTAIAVVARFLAQVPTRLVLTEHVTLSISEVAQTALQRWILRVTMRATFRFADVVTAVSQGTARDIAALAWLPSKDIRVIYNPIVASASARPKGPEVAVDKWWNGDHLRLLTVGSLKDQKDHVTLLQAVALVRRQLPVRLLILGEGPLRDSLLSLARELKLEDALDMPGFVEECGPYYGRADIFVLSSRWEGFGNVVVEAMAEGTTIVSTDCPWGPSEILSGGEFGTLVPVGGPEALASAILDRARYRTRPGDLKKRAQDFSIDRAVDAYIEILQGDS